MTPREKIDARILYNENICHETGDNKTQESYGECFFSSQEDWQQEEQPSEQEGFEEGSVNVFHCL